MKDRQQKNQIFFPGLNILSVIREGLFLLFVNYFLDGTTTIFD
jgi:hypothetical protein